MKQVNLYDTAFAHVDPNNHGMAGTKPSDFEWIRNQSTDPSRPAVFTENFIYANDISNSTASYNIGWLIECREILPARYEYFENLNPAIDFVMTFDKGLLEKYPEKTKFMPFGGCWIPRNKRYLAPKSKFCSMIFSEKNYMPGHQLRHKIFNESRHRDRIDFFGKGCNNPIDKKDDAIKDYAFHIVVENSNAENYFTEKLLDSFAYGTVPIYNGCPNIGDFFNSNGILKFDTVEELDRLLDSLEINEIESFTEYLATNLWHTRKYDIPEDFMYNNILKDL